MQPESQIGIEIQGCSCRRAFNVEHKPTSIYGMCWFRTEVKQCIDDRGFRGSLSS